MRFSRTFYSKGSGRQGLHAFGRTMAASLNELLAARNSWSQVITLELFEGQKNIFGDSFPVEASRRKDFAVIAGAVTPVPLYEFEVRELFVEASVKSGCRWWCRRSTPSTATRRVTRSLWGHRYVVQALRKRLRQASVIQGVDDTRASRHHVRCSCPAICKLRAVQVQNIFYNMYR